MEDEEFTEWATGAQRQLLRSGFLLTGDLARAEDLVQEAPIKVALRWSRLRTGNPTAYSRTIMVRDNISWWRRHPDVPSPTVHESGLVDTNDDFGGGKLPVIAVLDDGTALLQVPVFGNDFGWRLVAWSTSTGELSTVARGTGPAPASYALGVRN